MTASTFQLFAPARPMASVTASPADRPSIGHRLSHGEMPDGDVTDGDMTVGDMTDGNLASSGAAQGPHHRQLSIEGPDVHRFDVRQPDIRSLDVRRLDVRRLDVLEPGTRWPAIRSLAIALAVSVTLAAFGNVTPASAQQNNAVMAEAQTAQSLDTVTAPQSSTANQVQALQVQLKEPPAFIAFWKRFKAAAAADDRAALQAMTSLPFDIDGNRYDAKQFDKIHQGIYDAKARDCLSNRLPVPDNGDYDVFCGRTIYIFGTVLTFTPDQAEAGDGSGWRLLEISTN